VLNIAELTSLTRLRPALNNKLHQSASSPLTPPKAWNILLPTIATGLRRRVLCLNNRRAGALFDVLADGSDLQRHVDLCVAVHLQDDAGLR
jgi:hypothetical protein